jgi:hypothetical protein
VLKDDQFRRLGEKIAERRLIPSFPYPHPRAMGMNMHGLTKYRSEKGGEEKER